MARRIAVGGRREHCRVGCGGIGRVVDRIEPRRHRVKVPRDLLESEKGPSLAEAALWGA